jgi:hypothetical protein
MRLVSDPAELPVVSEHRVDVPKETMAAVKLVLPGMTDGYADYGSAKAAGRAFGDGQDYETREKARSAGLRIVKALHAAMPGPVMFQVGSGRQVKDGPFRFAVWRSSVSDAGPKARKLVK